MRFETAEVLAYDHPMAIHRARCLVAVLPLALACDPSPDTKTDTDASSSAKAPTQDGAAATPSPVSVDRANPCTFVRKAELETALGVSLAVEGDKRGDDAREIVSCNWTQLSGDIAVADIGVSSTPGEDAYKTNFDLAPAYFDGTPETITLEGADKAYLVTKGDQKAWVVGMLVAGKFMLVQLASDGGSPDKTKTLAALIAGRLR